MIDIDTTIKPSDLEESIQAMWRASAAKILSIERTYSVAGGAPVFTIRGEYTAQGWTEWTQGFQFGSAILQYDATGDDQFLVMGRENTVRHMASHVSHIGVHDHGFNNVSTYGNLRRLMLEDRIPRNQSELDFYEIALKISGAVQASRWTDIDAPRGYICSFNGPHSLFSDTIRSLRVLVVADFLGHVLMTENDRQVSLLERAIGHALSTAQFNVYYGLGRDNYDVRGRVVHESIFNTNDGQYRCPSTQQGYSPFSTWTRGLAWIMLGFAEQLEFLASLDPSSASVRASLESFGGLESVTTIMHNAAAATCDFYLANTPTDGIPYWDTGAPGLQNLGRYLERPSDPFNDFEPIDSSAAAIAVQGLIRFGKLRIAQGDSVNGERYFRAGLTTLRNLLADPYLSTDPDHQGLLLHTIYHRPNGWDHVPDGSKVPNGEACMWGDYHLLEAALLVQRLIREEPYLSFFGPELGAEQAAAD